MIQSVIGESVILGLIFSSTFYHGECANQNYRNTHLRNLRINMFHNDPISGTSFTYWIFYSYFYSFPAFLWKSELHSKEEVQEKVRSQVRVVNVKVTQYEQTNSRPFCLSFSFCIFTLKSYYCCINCSTFPSTEKDSNYELKTCL